MPAKAGRPAKANKNPEPTVGSQESITNFLANIELDSQEAEAMFPVTKVDDIIPPLNIRGIMIRDDNGEYYSPQKMMFAFNPRKGGQVRDVVEKTKEMIDNEEKKRADNGKGKMEYFHFKATIDKFAVPPTKVGGVHHGYISKTFPKIEPAEELPRRRKSPRRDEKPEDDD